jgi:hypothetical protein
VLSKDVSKDDAAPLQFFNTVYNLFETAEAACGGPVDRFYQIGGFNVRLRFAGPALIPYITPALAHLESAPRPQPDLTICLWDSDSTKTPMIPPPWSGEDYRERGEIRGFNTDRFRTVFMHGLNGLNLIDHAQNQAIYWVKTTSQIPYWEKGAPLRAIFHLWMGQQGVQLTHAAAIGIPSGGVLMVGKGGSGKSTTALACLNSKELFYASDDYCLVSCHATPTVFSLYSTGKKNSDDLQRLPFLAPLISNPNQLTTEKALYFLHDHFPEKLLPSFPIKAVLIPRITGQSTTNLTKASAAAGLAALAPSTIFQLAGAGPMAFQTMTKIAKQVPCYYLDLGSDPDHLPAVILKLLWDES